MDAQMMTEFNAPYSKAPIWAKKSPKRLAKFLTQDETDDSIKVRNIYTWITNNIRYDVKGIKKLSKESISVKETLKRRKGICYQYSDLFDELCKHANIQSYTISGYSKGLSYQWGTTFYESDHSWNAVKVNGKWKLVDATWGAGFVVQNRRVFRKLMYEWFRIPYLQDKYHFTKRPTPYYFDIAPRVLVNNHLPIDPNWQMLEYPVPLEVFEKDAKSIEEYLTRPDSTQRIDFLAGLKKYEFKGEENQLAISAESGHAFNPKNHRVLSIADLYKAQNRLDRTPENDLELIEINKELIPIYNQSIKNARAHQKVIKTEIASSRSKMAKQMSERMVKPTRQINKWVEQNLTYAAKKLARQKKTAISYQRLIDKQAQKTFGPLTSLRYSDHDTKPWMVDEHEITLTAIQVEIDAYDKGIDLVKETLSTSAIEKKKIMNEIMKTELEIDEWIPYVSNTYIRIYRLPLIDTMLQKVYIPMENQMSLIKQLKNFHLEERELWNTLKQLEANKINALKNQNSTIRDLCTDSEKRRCLKTQFLNNQIAIRDVVNGRHEMTEIKLIRLKSEIEFYEQYAFGLSTRIRQTAPQVVLADAYKEFQLEKLESRKNLSRSIIDNIILTCKYNISSLKAANKEAAARIRTSKLADSGK